MGNKLGWIIAGVLVAGLIVIIVLLVLFPQPTSPTIATRAEGVLELHGVGISPEAILGNEPGAPGNAADDYQKAIAVLKDDATFEALAEVSQNQEELKAGTYVPKTAALEAMKTIDAHVAAGAKKKQMKFVFVYTPKKLEVAYRLDAAQGFQDVAGGLYLLATYHIGQKDYAKAAKVLEHEFAMGWHMMQERAVLDIVRRGMGIQRQALEYLELLYAELGDAYGGRAAKVTEYRTALQEMSDTFGSKLSALITERPNPGDVFNIAENDKDRCWRVQAILMLGVLKYTATDRGDVRYRKKLIETYLASDDPLEAAAAEAAAGLTKEQFRGVGRKLL